MKILVPIDFSKVANNALQYALRFGVDSNLHIQLFHSFISMESPFYNTQKREDENKATANRIKKKLESIAQKAGQKNPRVAFEVYVSRGPAERLIPKFAATHTCDLIVMGTKGAGGLRETILGSETGEVVQRATCPVISVPGKFARKKIRRISFASDFQVEDLAALKYILPIAKRFDAHIEVIHFEEKPSSGLLNEKTHLLFQQMVKRFIHYPKLSFITRRAGNLTEELKRVSTHHKTDLMVMVTHERKGFFNKIFDKSLTKQVAYRTVIPLLSIPAGLREPGSSK